MLKINILYLVLFFVTLSSGILNAQEVQYVDSSENEKIFLVTLYSGKELKGTVFSSDEKELVLLVENLGKVAIPKLEVKTMLEISNEPSNSSGGHVPDQVFASRYFITTNGLSIKKGESYAIFTLLGPDINFGIADNWTVGLITSWLGAPLILTTKYSIQLKENRSLGLGFLAGDLTWLGAATNTPVRGVLPFASFTFGDRKRNLSFSSGYGNIWIDDEYFGASMLSIGAITYLTRKTSFVFDSIVLPYFDDGSNFFFVIPGLRFQDGPDRAFQFGFGMAAYNAEILPVPIPRFSWFRKF